MKIYRPKIVNEGSEVCVSARVKVDSVKSRLPDEIWFRFPASCNDYVTDHLNGFAAALLPLAMTLGEDLHMEGVLSPRLLNGMEEYQRIQCEWKPTSYKPVRIVPDQLQAAEIGPLGSGVGCSFSGGVDSYHTLWRHLPENEPVDQYRISHCLIINGFDADIDIDNQGHFSRIRDSFLPVMANHDLQLIVCRSNFMSFSDPNIAKQSFGALVVAPALVLGRLFRCFYVPSSYRFDKFLRDGSHLLIDHLISTESLETIHDSSTLKRTEKTEIIADWSETYPTLRVCFNETGYDEGTGLIMNCGRCEKCIRTITTLDILRKLDNYAIFTRTPSHFNIWMCYLATRGTRIHAREIMALAWKTGRLDIFMDFCIAIIVSLVIKIPKTLLRRIHLFLEERSEFYAVQIRRLYPRLRRRAYWIR